MCVDVIINKLAYSFVKVFLVTIRHQSYENIALSDDNKRALRSCIIDLTKLIATITIREVGYKQPAENIRSKQGYALTTLDYKLHIPSYVSKTKTYLGLLV